MNFSEIALKRRTIRDFDSKPVDASALNEAVADAFTAPTYNHLREWHFIMIKDLSVRIKITETEEMTEVLTDSIISSFAGHDSTAKEMYMNAIPKQKRMIIDAPELAVVAFLPKTAVAEAGRVYDLNCLASVWCCIENFLLSLSEKNIFGVTFIPKNTSAVKAVLNIPQEYEVAAVIPFGYKKENAEIPPVKKIDLKSRIHHDGWS